MNSESGISLLSLDEIGIRHNTDKASHGHDYLRRYETHLIRFRNLPITLLELGVGPKANMGKSLLTWKDYFPLGVVVGVDIRPDASSIAQNRISIEVGNCGNPLFLGSLAQKYRPHIIIDDASHNWSHQMLAFEALWPSLKPGGVFIIEDLHTSFPPLTEKAYADCPIRASDYFLYFAALTLSAGNCHDRISPSPKSPAQHLMASSIAAVEIVPGAMLLVKKDLAATVVKSKSEPRV